MMRAVIPNYHVRPNSITEFALAFRSKGMEKLNFSPLGTDYIVTITSNYVSPSFKGDFLRLEILLTRVLKRNGNLLD